LQVKFVKYQALGNDYLVIHPADLPAPLTPDLVRRLCDRHYGPGADGLLLGPLPGDQAGFALRIYNPDGSEAELSGNGLRIFSRCLWDQGLLPPDPAAPPGQRSLPFTLLAAAGAVRSQVLEGGRLVRLEIGRASFDSRRIPVTGPRREVLDETLSVGGETLRYCAVSLGNPHCVILCQETSEALARRLGPLVEVEPRFPRRANVQFMQVLARDAIRIHIWERGAGHTLASGSSSCAAAAAAHRLGLVDADVTVHNPGGPIQVAIAPDGVLTMTGPVHKVYAGVLVEQAC
jgi:diaminopimelate epimerase